MRRPRLELCLAVALPLMACGGSPSPSPVATPASNGSSAAKGKSPTLKKKVNGIDLAYEEYGSGMPVIFLHGVPTDRRSMIPRFEPMFTSGSKWRRIYPDMPGVGDTPGSASISDLEGYTDVLAAFFDAVTEGKRFAIVGTSFGAYLTLLYARKHADRLAGMALIVPTASHSSPRPEKLVIVKEPGVVDGEPPAFVEQFEGVTTVQTRAIRDRIKRDVAPGARTADEAFFDRINEKPVKDPTTVRQLQFDRPTLIMSGRQDIMCGYVGGRELAERLPRATFVALDRAGHALMNEQEDLLRAHTSEWLARVREGLGESYERP